ncbi:MAG: D-alanyl-D-alanine carboxypeptidase family protein, partial [Lachnospiraceae bacterium]|nr:D-alanyl-D-alanine carboxypeptidase family protein [Lachnospiraceae bacterium]
NGLEGWPQGEDIISKYACLMDVDTGAVLYDKDMNTTSYPASITKLMTTLLTFENGNLDDVTAMGDEAVYWVQADSSSLWTVEGEEFTIDELLRGTLIKSANDMATQLGVYLGGDVASFAEMMNAKAAELGCRNTHFVNACGMHDEDHYTSAYDMALIGKANLAYDRFREIIAMESSSIEPTNMNEYYRSFDTHVKLIYDSDYYYDGILGGKTGYTDEAGNTLVTYAERNGRTLVCVTMMGDGVGNTASDHIQLLDYGFDHFENIELTDGTLATVPTGTAEDDLELRTTEAGTEEGSVTDSWYYSGQRVGSSMVTSEVSSQIQENIAAAELAAKNSLLEGIEHEELSEKPANTGKGFTQIMDSLFSAEMNQTAMIIICVLVILILIMTLSIIVMLIKGRKRRQ